LLIPQAVGTTNRVGATELVLGDCRKYITVLGRAMRNKGKAVIRDCFASLDHMDLLLKTRPVHLIGVKGEGYEKSFDQA